MAESAADVAENSHPNLHLFDLSLTNTFNSEIPGYSSSSSFPSEPPDIGKWFSSYVYESPALDTEEELKGIVSGESESEKAGFISEEIIGRKKEDNLMELRNHVDKDAFAFGKKLSSSGDNKQQNVSLNKGKSNLFVTKKGENESLDGKLVEDHNFFPIKDDTTPCLRNEDSQQKMEEKFSFPSDLSEPPDIRNWFSSYVYESPALDTGEELNGSVSGRSESEKVGFISEEIGSKNEDDLGELRNHADKDVSVFCGGDNKHQNESVNKGKSNLFVTKIGENESLGANHDLVPFKDDAIPCLPSVDSPLKLEENFSSEVDYILSKRKINSSANNEKCQLNLLERKGYKENQLQGKGWANKVDLHEDSRKSNGVFSKKSLPCSHNEEEEEINVMMNGFVSTKNNCTSKNGRGSLKSSRKNQIVDEMQTSVVRKPFSERTNIFLNEVVAPGIIGKWKCPQKSKPDLGPPMKQQRLERWIHRV